MTEQDITEIVRQYVDLERDWFAEQVDVKRSVLEFKSGTRLRVSRTKVDLRCPDDKQWLDISDDFPVALSRDQSMREEER